MFKRLLLLSALAGMQFSTFAASDFPSKPVRIVVPYAAGGVADTQARMLGQKLQAKWNQSVIVENRPGGNTVIGTSAVAKAPTDCHTMLLSGLPVVLNDIFYDTLPYQRQTELAPVSIISIVPNVLVTHKDSPFNSVQELVAYGQANPGKLSFGSTGTGGSSHLSGELLASMAKLDMVHVPYRGGAAAQSDLATGRIDLMFDSSSLPNIKAGLLKPLAVSTEQSSALLPDILPMSELGYPGFSAAAWFALWTSASVDMPACAQQLSADIAEVAQNPELKENYFTLGAEIWGSSAQEMQQYQDAELQRWSAVIKERDIKISQ